MYTSEQSLYQKIIAVSNRRLCSGPLPEQARRVCRRRPKAFLLREKDLPPEAYLALAREILEVCESFHLPCILHSYTEAARKLGCGGIHLPLPLLRQQSRELQDFSVIGASVHSPEEAAEAEALGATYVTAGHIYATDCKKGVPPRGTGFLRAVCESVSIPVYAIGGIRISLEQMDEVLACGAAGGCIMSGMMRL